MEPTEIREFTEQMESAGEKSLTYVSLIISILAVLVAMVTVLGHREHTEAVLMQARATDQWNEYQSHRIREQTLETTNTILSATAGRDFPAVKAKMAEYQEQMSKWVSDVRDEAEKARDLEREVGVAEHKAARYDVGEALLQIAVVLASVTLLTRKPIYVLAASILGAAGLLTALTGFLIH